MPKGSGRRPLPTAVKKLRGNPGKRKTSVGEPKPAAGEPTMPAGLGAAAAAEWKAIVPELAKLGVLTVIDGKALAGYCHAYARWMQAERDVLKYGLTIEEPVIDGETGEQRQLDGRELVRLKKNPAISTANDAMKLMKSFLVEFGMTPAARTRLKVDAPPEEDKFGNYLRGAHGGESETVH